MYKQKLCLGLNPDFGLDTFEQLEAFKAVGFDAFFSGFENRENVLALADAAAQKGLIYQSVHAPFHKTRVLWRDGEEGEAAVKELTDCVNAVADAGVKIVVSHVFIGFDQPDKPNEIGLERLSRVVEKAEQKGVKIAFENTEGEEFLFAVMERFKHSANVGFCWDSGHEQCYNYGKDMTALYGDRLFCTHINDNLGISDSGGRIYWTDDLHLLPFDGIIDWKEAAARLNRAGYDDILTFELNRSSKRGRHDNDKYESMTPLAYLTEVYARACRFAALKLSLK